LLEAWEGGGKTEGRKGLSQNELASFIQPWLGYVHAPIFGFRVTGKFS
jgi:hypothetical protein